MRIHSKIFPFIRHGFMTMTEPGRSKKKGFAYDFMKKEKKTFTFSAKDTSMDDGKGKLVKLWRDSEGQ